MEEEEKTWEEEYKREVEHGRGGWDFETEELEGGECD